VVRIPACQQTKSQVAGVRFPDRELFFGKHVIFVGDLKSISLDVSEVLIGRLIVFGAVSAMECDRDGA
jgi:hypothetical protein